MLDTILSGLENRKIRGPSPKRFMSLASFYCFFRQLYGLWDLHMGIGRYQALFCSWDDEHMRRRIVSSLSWAGHWANLGYLCEEGILWQAF